MPLRPSNPALRSLPKVQALADSSEGIELIRTFTRAATLAAIRDTLQSIRTSILSGSLTEPPAATEILRLVQQRLNHQRLTGLQRVINATGIVLHTNLGRAPMARSAAEAVARIATGYCNLEMDLVQGKRGVRGGRSEPLLRELTGAEDALVVNNNAAGVLLALAAHAKGGEVIISRGELVEIGGSFRMPDVIRQSGARVVEVGSTNRTRLSDYADAITTRTRILLKVHPSNFRISGFVGTVDVARLSKLASERGLLLMEDLGSGALIDLTKYGLPQEPTAAEAITAGADIVAFSADKLLGGPQAGIICGKTSTITAMRKHPLMRALRPGKLVLAALEATLQLYLEPSSAASEIPVLAVLAQPNEALDAKAHALAYRLSTIPGLTVEIADGVSFAGGGALAERELHTRQVRVRSRSVSARGISEHLRQHSPPIIGTVSANWFVMDVRTVFDADLPEIAMALEDV